MKATFIYSESEVKAALLAYHEKKIGFNPRKYEITCDVGELESLVIVKEKDSIPLKTLKDKLKFYFNLTFTGGY